MMKSILVASLVLCSTMTIGCSEKSSVKEETKITTPKGSTVITTEKDVKKTGDHKN